MEYSKIIAASALTVMILLTAPAEAQMAKDKPDKAMQNRSQDVAERLEAEQEGLSRKEKAMREKSSVRKDDQTADEDSAGSGLDNAATQGNEKAAEMRSRRDERKAIKEEYKASDRGGERDTDKSELESAADALDTDAVEEAESGQKKAKKPWWKFWE